MSLNAQVTLDKVSAKWIWTN